MADVAAYYGGAGKGGQNEQVSDPRARVFSAQAFADRERLQKSGSPRPAPPVTAGREQPNGAGFFRGSRAALRYLLKALRDYKAGARKNPIMGGQVGSLTSQDMADLAAFYSSQKGSLHVIREAARQALFFFRNSHRSRMMHAGQPGFYRLAHVAPVQDQPVVRVLAEFLRNELEELVLDFAYVLAGSEPVRLATRKMCVSTAMVGWPKAVLRITLAVFLPTPGSASSASRDCGTSPPCRSRSSRQVSRMCFALERYRPIVRMCSINPSMPRASRPCGVLATR